MVPKVVVKFGKFRNSLQHVDVHVLVSWGRGGGCLYVSVLLACGQDFVDVGQRTVS